MRYTAIYERVSTVKQDTRSQHRDLEAHPADGHVVWYCDKASGTTMERPAWRELEAAIRQGKVATLVVWRLDRLGRTAKGLTALFDELRERKVNLVSIKDGVDLSTPAGRLMANVIASVAQYETEVRGERVRAGQAAAKAAGKTWGGATTTGRRKATDEQLECIRTLHDKGTPVARIAKSVGLSRPTTLRMLKELELCPA